MEQIFLKVISMSAAASIVIMIVCLLRSLLQWAPKWISYALWLIVLIRLICPVTFATPIGVIPQFAITNPFSAAQQENSSNRIQGSNEFKHSGTDLAIDSRMSGTTGFSGNRQFMFTQGKKAAGSRLREIQTSLSDIPQAATIIWFLGMAAWMVCMLKSSLGLKKKLRRLGKNGKREAVIYSEQVKEPFVEGILHPVIYLPAGLPKEQETYVLAHEKAHIRRKDYLVKPLAFLVAAVHWFNPFVWLALWLLGRDMEMSCDEAVLKMMGEESKKAYARTLLNLSAGERGRIGAFVAFGESSIKRRIKNMMKYKKTKIWISLLLLAGVIAAAGCLLTDADTEQTVLQKEAGVLQKGAEAPQKEAGVLQKGTEALEGMGELEKFEKTKEHTLAQHYIQPIENARISKGFETRIHPMLQEEITHNGVDFAAEKGTPILAAADGTVLETGTNAEYGNYIILLHKSGESTYYTNCDKVLAEEGEEIRQGSHIADVGNTGASTGTHLHFAVSEDGEFIKPVFGGRKLQEIKKENEAGHEIY